MRKRIVIAVAQANTEPWISIWKNGQEETWMRKRNEFIKIINFQSKSTPKMIRFLDSIHEKYRFDEKIGKYVGYFDSISSFFISKKCPSYQYNEKDFLLVADSWSTYQLAGRRNLALFDWFLTSTDAEFLLMSNTSSFFNLENLSKLVESFNPRDFIYAGYIVSPDQDDCFVSGAGKLLSRSVVQLAYENYKFYSNSNLEDVDFGKLMRRLGIKPISLTRIDVPNIVSALNLPRDTLVSEYHYRCKGDAFPRQDIEIMKTLEKRLLETS